MTPHHQIPPPAAQFNFAAHLLARNAGRPDKIAYIDDLGRLSFATLADRVRRMASALRAAGIRREERILLLMHDSNDWPVSFLGALYAGIQPVAVNTLLTVDDYAYMLEHSRAQAVIVSSPLVAALNAAMDKAQHEVGLVIVAGARLEEFVMAADPLTEPARTRPDDPAFWLYSSGSTGSPKGTVHTHANPYWTAELYGTAILGLREDDICFSAAKLFFAYGLGNALSFPLSVGATTVLMAERPTPAAVFKRLMEHRATLFFGAPTGFAAMLASPDLPAPEVLRLRLASSAGEALPADLGQRFTQHFGVDVIDGIGSTEMLHIFISNRPGDVRYGTTGRPVPGYQIDLRDDGGQPTPDGEIGDLFIQGPSSALMYWGAREKTQATFQGIWTKSGDKYVKNSDGTYTYSGRSDDMIKVSGIYVSPFEVEATLALHPAVLEAAVVGVTDLDGLTKAKAFVVLKADQAASEEELKSFVKDRLAPYKYPRQIEFLAELPKTATGKIQRFKLRQREAPPA